MLEFEVKLENARKIRDSYFRQYLDARDRAEEAHYAVNGAFKEMQEARREMKAEFLSVRDKIIHNNETWEEYHKIRDENDRLIKKLVAEANDYHQKMKRAFNDGNSLRTLLREDEAAAYFRKAHDYLDKRNEANKKVQKLIAETRRARDHAEEVAPRIDKSRYYKLKSAFEEAKKEHEKALETFRKIECEKYYYREKYDNAHVDFIRLKQLRKTGVTGI